MSNQHHILITSLVGLLRGSHNRRGGGALLRIALRRFIESFQSRHRSVVQKLALGGKPQWNLYSFVAVSLDLLTTRSQVEHRGIVSA